MDFSAKRSEGLLKLHTHTQNVLLYVLLCVLYGKKSLLFTDYVKYRTCIRHTYMYMFVM